MSAPSLVRRTAVVAAAVTVAGLAVAGATTPQPAHADGSSDGTKVVVTVIESSASPTGTPTPTATATSTATTTSGPSSSATASGPGQPSATPTGSGTPPGDLGGLLYVSGLTWVYHPSVDPFGGALELRFAVRNVSTVTVDASARFWISALAGGTVGLPVDVPVTGLKADETRTVSATIDGIGPWGLVLAHLLFTPPERLGDTTLVPVTREALAWFAAWPFLGGIGIGGGVLAWWLLIVRRGLRLSALFGARP